MVDMVTRQEAFASLVSSRGLEVTDEEKSKFYQWVDSTYSTRDMGGYLRLSEAGYLLNCCINPKSLKMAIPVKVYSVDGSLDLFDYPDKAKEQFGLAGDVESVIELSSRRALALPLFMGMVRLLTEGISWDGSKLTLFHSLKPCPREVWEKILDMRQAGGEG